MEKKGKYLPVWGRYADMMRSMPKDQAGELIQAMLGYYFDEEEPEELSEALRCCWFLLQQDMDDAIERYETKVENCRKGGRRSAQRRQEQTEPEETAAPAPTEPEEETTEPEELQLTALNNTQPRTRKRTRTRSITRSRTEIDPPVAPLGGVSPEKQSYGEFGWVKLTQEEYGDLEKQWGTEVLTQCIGYIDRSAQSTGNRNRWKDWALVLRRCQEEKWYQPKHLLTREEIPKGATGHLGEAELEAIRAVLAQ